MSFIALWLGVAVLGGLGALARFLLDGLLSASSAGDFPLGTLVVNLSGTLLLGVLVGATLRGDGYLLAGTATLGSYTTFSTWILESHRSAEDGRGWIAIVNILLSVALGLAAAELGRRIAGG